MKRCKSKMILGEMYTYHYEDLSAFEFDGLCDVNEKTITLDKTLRGEEFIHKKLHEEGHVLWDRLSLDQTAAAPFEEIICDAWAKYISENYVVKDK